MTCALCGKPITWSQAVKSIMEDTVHKACWFTHPVRCPECDAYLDFDEGYGSCPLCGYERQEPIDTDREGNDAHHDQEAA